MGGYCLPVALHLNRGVLMTKADLIALAERVERAEGLDRELDAEIAPLKGLRRVDEGQPIGRVWYDHRGHGVPLPAFTASIDAAMTLAGEREWSVSHFGSGHQAGAEVWFHADEQSKCSEAATPSLALTAASLRAIAEEMD